MTLAALGTLAPANGQGSKTAAEKRQVTNSIGMKLTLVPAGEFKMGSGESAEATAGFFNTIYGGDLVKADWYKDEHPQHRVRITKPFYLGTYHVTRGQFRQFVKDTGYRTDAERSDVPGGGDGTSTRKFPCSSKGARGRGPVSNRPTSTQWCT